MLGAVAIASFSSPRLIVTLGLSNRPAPPLAGNTTPQEGGGAGGAAGRGGIAPAASNVVMLPPGRVGS